MKVKIFIILPTQLFEDISYLQYFSKIFIIEDPYYLNSSFHKQKLYLHHTSLLYYYEYLKGKKVNVEYINLDKCNYKMFNNTEHHIEMYNPIDRQSIINWSLSKVHFIDPLTFICSSEDLRIYKEEISKNKHKYTHNHFYKWQRSRLNILMKDFMPLYNRWSFDTENRSKFPNNYKEFKISFKIDIEIKEFIEKRYPNSFGYLSDISYYPSNHNDAKKLLNFFITNKLEKFGNIQDAFSKNVTYGNHSIISSSLNIGLLTPQYVIKRILDVFNKSNKKRQIISSVEGFIRQIIGWREYMRFIYTYFYNDIIKTSLPLTNSITLNWYNGNTELNILNHYIEKVKQYAYLHHIERLMIINNLGMLYNIKFNDMYNWFMICFIDSYDWVMIPNLLMNYNSINPNISFMTRMYISSYNYINKMSDFKDMHDKEIINQLYINFLKKNGKLLSKDYILVPQLKRLKVSIYD